MSLDEPDFEGDFDRGATIEAAPIEVLPILPSPPLPRPISGPVVDPVGCSGCGKLIDPLRAGHVAIFDLRFHFFCSRSVCRAVFLGDQPQGRRRAPRRARRCART